MIPVKVKSSVNRITAEIKINFQCGNVLKIFIQVVSRFIIYAPSIKVFNVQKMLTVWYLYTRDATEQSILTKLFLENIIILIILVVQFGWIDHEPPPFELLQRLIDDMFNYLSQHPNNGIAIHCKVFLRI